jgi:hypothetical protein
MATLQIKTKVDGVYADVTSVVLTDQDAVYGVKRTDTGEIIVAAGVAMNDVGDGVYTYPVSIEAGISYLAYAQITYGGGSDYIPIAFTAAGDIATTSFKAAIASILYNDSVQSDAGTLGALMDYDATARPNLVFHDFSPQQVKPPKLTYRIESQAGYFPRNLIFTVTAYGDNFTAILERVRDLLHDRRELTADDFYIEAILYDSSGPELWDDDLKTFFRVDRYRAIVAVK